MLRRIRTNKFMSFLMLAIVCIFVSSTMVSCSWISKITGSEDPVINSYKGMYGTGSIYGVALSGISLLQKQGVVSIAQREIVNKVSAMFQATYYSAVDYLVIWKLNQGTPNETELATNFQNILVALTGNWQAFQDAINTLSPGLIQGKIELAPVKKVILRSMDNPATKAALAPGYKKDPKKIDPTIVPIIISVIGLIVQYGIPQAVALMEALKKPTITVEDIKALKGLVKDPVTY